MACMLATSALQCAQSDTTPSPHVPGLKCMPSIDVLLHEMQLPRCDKGSAFDRYERW